MRPRLPSFQRRTMRHSEVATNELGGGGQLDADVVVDDRFFFRR